MSLWMAMPELCPCGGVAALRIEEGGAYCDAEDGEEAGACKIIDYLLYECPTCKKRGSLSITEGEARESFHNT